MQRLRPTALVISATIDQTAGEVPALAELVRSLPAPRPIFAFGGQPFEAQPDLRESVSGVYLGPNAQTAAEGSNGPTSISRKEPPSMVSDNNTQLSLGARPEVGPELRFRHRFRVRARAAEAADFHRRSASLQAITPPLLLPRVEGASDRLEAGDRVLLRLGVAPLEIRWLAQIEQARPLEFADRQLAGPFESWLHRHTFRPLGDGSTEVRDEVRARLRRHPLWGPLGLSMWASLPLLFAYRAWRTRRLLEGQA